MNVFLTRINEARRSIAAERGMSGIRPVALMGNGGEGERDLARRLSSSADPAGDLEHVLTVAIDEARDTGELRWLGWALANEKAWRTRLAAPLKGGTKPRQPARRSVFDALDDAADELNGRTRS